MRSCAAVWGYISERAWDENQFPICHYTNNSLGIKRKAPENPLIMGAVTELGDKRLNSQHTNLILNEQLTMSVPNNKCTGGGRTHGYQIS